MDCPCQNCKSRKPVCHDRCEEYNEWHETLVCAKEALRTSEKAIDLLIAAIQKRKKARHTK